MPSVPTISKRVDWSILTAVWIAMIVIVDPIGDFPLNDDWLFAMAVRSVLDHGHLQIPSLSAPDVGPQVYWGALFCLPFGFSFTALRFSTLVLGLVGVLAFHALFLAVWKDRALALVAALTLMVDPLYIDLSNSFMTDVPFLALAIVSMLLIVRGMEQERRGPLLAGIAVALAAVLIRQFALAVLAGYGCARLARGGWSPRNLARAAWPATLGLVLHFAFDWWLFETGRKPYPSGITDISPSSLGLLSSESFERAWIALLYVGLFTLPLAAACLVRVRPRMATAVAAVALALGAPLVWRGVAMPLGVNILEPWGFGPLALRDVCFLLINLPTSSAGSTRFWIAMSAVSTVGAAAIVVSLGVGAGRLIARGRPAVPWMPVFFAGIAISYVGVLLAIGTSHAVFDRYYLLLVVVVMLALPVPVPGGRAPRVRRFGRVPAVLLVIGMAWFTIAATRDYLEWNRLRWDALDRLTADAKIDPRRIDGGYEFNGWTLYDPLYEPHDYKSWWWVEDDEYLIASGPVTGYREIDRRTLRRWLTGSDTAIVVLHRYEYE